MSESKEEYGPPMKLFNVLGAAELKQMRLLIVLGFVILVMTTIVIGLLKMNWELQETNRTLQSERVMYGFPNGEGVFISERTLPDSHLRGLVTWFVQNYYNFTPESAQANANEALRLMTPKLRARLEDALKKLAQQSIEQNITQVFAVDTKIEIENQPGIGYVATFRGQRLRATLNQVFSKQHFQVKLLIKPVKPSAHFAWAAVVDDFIVQEL